MTSLEQWGVPLAVLGMLLLTLFMAAVLKRHQAHQVEVRAAVRRLDSGLAALSSALDTLAGVVPLSQELRVTLRGEMLARYRKIRRLYPGYPGIAEKLRTAEIAVSTQGASVSAGVGPIDSERAMRGLLAALDQLAGLIARGNLVRPVPRDVRAIFVRELGERRAEVLARYYLVGANRCEQDGSAARARGYLTTLMQVLRRRGPSTPFVSELCAEAESALSGLSGPGQNTDSGVGRAEVA